MVGQGRILTPTMSYVEERSKHDYIPSLRGELAPLPSLGWVSSFWDGILDLDESAAVCDGAFNCLELEKR